MAKVLIMKPPKVGSVSGEYLTHIGRRDSTMLKNSSDKSEMVAVLIMKPVRGSMKPVRGSMSSEPSNPQKQRRQQETYGGTNKSEVN